MQSRPNPFLDDIYVGDLSGSGQAVVSVESLHRDELDSLRGHVVHLGGGDGAVILLRSSRAGMGKSHLLSRLVSASSADGFFVELEVNRDSRPGWARMLRGVLGACSEARSGKGTKGISFLDEMSRRLMGEAAAELILRGDVPTADPAAAITMLKRDYLRAFDMRNGGSDVARWMVSNFNVLLPLMGEVLGSRAVVDVDEAVAWLRVLARFNAGSASERRTALASVTMAGDDEAAKLGAKQRLRSFCRLAAIDRPLVLVFDHVDALAKVKDDAMGLACMIGEMGRQRFGAGVILSVNGDVWTSVFDGNLPGALEDRLTGRIVEVSGIDVSEAEEMVAMRLREAEFTEPDVARFLEQVRLGDMISRRGGGTAAPREILRHAAAFWDRLARPRAEKAGSSVKDYLPGKEELPGGSSLAEPATLRPMVEVVRRAKRFASDETGGEEPGKVDPGTIRQMSNISSLLRELKSRREQFVPGDPGGEAKAIAPQMDEVEEADDVSPLVRRFDEIRGSMLNKRGQRLDLEALRRMVSLAGERFPVVESSEFKMSPGEEPLVMKWAFPGNEILFGFEPEHQFRYWQSLIKLAARRAASGAAGRLKLVVFSENEHPFSGAASADESELEAAREDYLDVIDLDAGMIASVIAADRVVYEMAKEEVPVLPADAIRELAPQLDPLWRRITRPLVASDEGERAV